MCIENRTKPLHIYIYIYTVSLLTNIRNDPTICSVVPTRFQRDSTAIPDRGLRGTADLPRMDSRPRKISESRYIYAGLYFDLFGCPDLAISPYALVEARRATIYTRLSGWANKVPYIGYDGGRCREHNALPRSPFLPPSPPRSSAFFVNSPSYFAAGSRRDDAFMKTGRAPSILA